MSCGPVAAPRKGEPAYIHISAMPRRLSGTVALLFRAMLHVFARQDGLTLAFCKFGGGCFRVLDIIGVMDCIDLRTAAGRTRLLEACADPRVVYVAFGPACGSFCRSHVNQSMYGLRMLVEDGCPQPGGCFHRKRTELLTNFIALKWLRRTCTRTHEHIELQG